MPHLDADILAKLMAASLTERQVDSVSAAHVVASLIQTSLRGVDSHGINLFPHYCRAVDAGRINGNPVMTFSQTGEATACLDADHAFGHHAGVVGMDKAVELARQTGVGAVSVKNSTHFGAAAYFGLRAPKSDCLGFAFTNADALVKAFGAKSPFFGTNPICFTAPLAREEPFCLDMATSLVSWNKINNYRRGNEAIPSDWAFDAEGQSVTDPHLATSLNPAGGYKGFGLGMMVDILCALLADGPISKEIMPMYAPPLDGNKRKLSHFFMAIDISRFILPTAFKDNMQTMVDRIRSMDALVPGQPVMVAGDPEKGSIKRRSVEGIPVDDLKFLEFVDLDDEFRTAVLR